MSQTEIGILAMQGGYREHQQALSRCGATPRLVRSKDDFKGIAGLIIPGGESTVMEILLRRSGLWEEVGQSLRDGLPVMGTCAGVILLAKQIADGRPDQTSFGCLDVAVRRNGYGRQQDSFEAPLEVDALPGGAFPGVFIRAPRVVDPGSTKVLAAHRESAVAVLQDKVLGLCFHPELTSDDRFHRFFLEQVIR